MNTDLRSQGHRLPGLRSPGWNWLPAVWRRADHWRTVWRFVWLGPLIGGAPYVWTLVAIPFAYLFGALPALLAGLLFAAWYHGMVGRPPSWPWRAVVGALAGLGAVVLLAMAQMLGAGERSWFFPGIAALHGVPAALVLGLLQRRSRATPPPGSRGSSV